MSARVSHFVLERSHTYVTCHTCNICGFANAFEANPTQDLRTFPCSLTFAFKNMDLGSRQSHWYGIVNIIIIIMYCDTVWMSYDRRLLNSHPSSFRDYSSFDIFSVLRSFLMFSARINKSCLLGRKWYVAPHICAFEAISGRLNCQICISICHVNYVCQFTNNPLINHRFHVCLGNVYRGVRRIRQFVFSFTYVRIQSFRINTIANGNTFNACVSYLTHTTPNTQYVGPEEWGRRGKYPRNKISSSI